MTMIIPPGDSITAVFLTLDADRVLTAPSAGPSAVVYKNGVVDGTTSTTITNVSTGVYRVALTPSASTYAEGDYLAVVLTATVATKAVSQVVIQERLTGAIVAIEELQDQIAEDQTAENALLTSIEAKANATNTAVQTSGVLLTTGAIASIQTAVESDPQMQLMMALTGIMGGSRTAYASGVATYVMNKPAGGTVTVVHNENTGAWTVA